MISAEKKKEAVEYSLKTIEKVCTEIGPRESGSEKEREAQELFQKELLENKWADESTIDTFTISRHALVGFTKIIGVFLIIASLLQFLWFTRNSTVILAANIISIILVALSLSIFFFEFIIYRKFIDWALPKSTSYNVYAKYKPTGEVKRRIVLNGHTDSAYEWTLMKVHQNLMVILLVGCFVFAVASLGFYINNAIKGYMSVASLVVSSIAAVVFISLFFVCTFKTISPGANDNLSGVLTAMATLKCLKESNIRFENTEVAVLLSGAEEAGLRGAEAWAKKYKEEIDEVETAVIVFDTLRDFEHTTIYYRDMTGLVKNSEKVVRLLDKACEKIGHPLKHGIVPFGSSDAAILSRNKVEAACVAAQNPKGTDYYHTRNDRHDNMCEKTMALGLDIALAAVEVFDKEGLS